MTDSAPDPPESLRSLKGNDEVISTPYVRSNEDNLDEAPLKMPIRKTLAHKLEHYFCFSKSGLETSVCVISGAIIFACGYLFGVPNQRPIPYQYLENTGEYIRNLAYDQEDVDSTIPTWVLGIIALVLCPLLQFLLSFTSFAAAGDVHRTICVYAMTIPVNEFITWSLKLYVGWLRPNFYAICQPDENYEYCSSATGDDESFEESMNLRLSFPSGHASWSFATLTLLYLFLERTFGLSSIAKTKVLFPVMTPEETTIGVKKADLVLEYQRPPFMHRVFSVLALAPLGLAIFIASSRIVDNKHFPADVIAGSLVGAFVAHFFHHLWFPDPRFTFQA